MKLFCSVSQSVLPRRLLLLTAALLTVTSLNGPASAENWTRFRGADGSGTSTEQGIPATWSPGEVAWRVELPGMGHAAPVIWGEMLFVTSAIDEGAMRYLYCLNAATGKEIWSRETGMNRSHKHLKSSWASSTPVTDGEQVFVAFADADDYTLAAYTVNGELQWRRNLGSFESQHGQGVSPILFENLVIIPNDQDGPSSIRAFDKDTGRTVWSTLRGFRRTSYATPVIYTGDDGEPQLITASGGMGLASLDPRTGVTRWVTGELPARTVSSPVIAGNLIIQTCGGGGKGKLLVAVDPSEPDNASKERIVYERDRVLPYVPTPLFHEGHMYLWNDNGVVSCMEAATGKNIWTERVGGNYTGSPVLIDGRIFIISEKGEVVVVAASPEYKLLGRTALNEESHSTPSVANGRLFLRTFHSLVCIEGGSKTSVEKKAE